MAVINPLNIIVGPAIVTFNGASYWSQGDIEVKAPIPNFDIKSSAFGAIDLRAEDRVLTISFTPVGEWEALPKLWPYATTAIKAKVCTNLALTIHTLDGQLYTFPNACISKCPDIICSPIKTLIGPVEFTAITENGKDWIDVGSLYTLAALAFSGAEYSTIDSDAIKTVPFVAAWGAAPWDNIETTEDGWVISMPVSLGALKTARVGTANFTLNSVGVVAKAMPMGITEAQKQTALGLSGGAGLTKRGQSLKGRASDLVLTGDGGAPVITVKKAALTEGGFNFGDKPRIGEMQWAAIRTVSTTLDPLFTLA